MDRYCRRSIRHGSERARAGRNCSTDGTASRGGRTRPRHCDFCTLQRVALIPFEWFSPRTIFPKWDGMTRAGTAPRLGTTSRRLWCRQERLSSRGRSASYAQKEERAPRLGSTPQTVFPTSVGHQRSFFSRHKRSSRRRKKEYAWSASLGPSFLRPIYLRPLRLLVLFLFFSLVVVVVVVLLIGR